MSKTALKAIIKRSKLRSTFSKEKSSENWQNCKGHLFEYAQFNRKDILISNSVISV